MIEAGHWRGYTFYSKDGNWFSTERTDCGFCGRERTPEGHDGCLGTLPEAKVMNACCGHGAIGNAYIQFWNGSRISGDEAVEMIRELQELTPIGRLENERS